MWKMRGPGHGVSYRGFRYVSFRVLFWGVLLAVHAYYKGLKNCQYHLEVYGTIELVIIKAI